MLCSNCGTILSDDTTECSYCGYQLTESISYRGEKNTGGDMLAALKRALDVIRSLEAIEEKEIEFAQIRENIEQESQKILDDDMPGALVVLCLIVIIVAGDLQGR